MFPIFKKVFKYEITEDDLFKPLLEHKSDNIGPALEEFWYKEYSKRKKNALIRALFKLFGRKFMLYGFVKCVDEIMLIVVNPFCIGKVVSFFEVGQTRISKVEAYVYTVILLLCLFTNSILCHPSFMGMQHIAMKIRVACSALVYRKILKFSRTALMGTHTGQLVNLLSNDVAKFDEAFMLIHFVWIGPTQVAIGTYLLYRQIGYGAYCGMGFLLCFVPLQICLAHKTSILRYHTALKTDERIRLMNEIISGIQVIKMYCWEKSFARLTQKARGDELKYVRLHAYVIGIIYSFEIFVSRSAIFVSILGFVLLGNKINAEKVFAVTAIFNCLRPVITMHFSLSITSLSEIYISLLRIQRILEFDEIESDSGFRKKRITLFSENVEPKLILKNVYAKWVNENAEDTLINVNINISSNLLLGIIGPVGGGKTSIFNLILGELPMKSGIMEVVGTISYASQDPWLFASTIRENILFGEQYNKIRYKQVVQACALKEDFISLPFGDRTLIGERGKSLSGGQKARISLARCVYKKAHIYLLDDPLSAVDAKVAKHIYKECIKSFLSNSICILITHQLQLLKDADQILVIDDGEIEISGTYEQIRNSGRDIAQIMENYEEEDKEIIRKDKMKSRYSSVLFNEDLNDIQTIDKEYLERGKISMSTYMTYYRAGGNYISVTILVFLFVSCQVFANGGEWFVSYWVNLEEVYANDLSTKPELNRTLIIIQYSFLTIGTIVVAVIKSVYFMVYLTNGSRQLHNMMYARIQYAPMRFYDTNPSGRILNRFTRDMSNLDEFLPSINIDVNEISLGLFGVFVLSALVQPYLLLVDSVLLIIFYLVRIVYVETSRNVKRIEAITKSPMYSHMTATMTGLDTIRSFHAEKMLIQQFDELQDTHSSAWFLYIASGKCFGQWLDITCQVFTGLVVFLILFFSDEMQGGDMGLVITQYLGLMGTLQWGMRQWAELENNMTSVERILEYTKIDIEPIRADIPYLPSNWPQYGRIEFKHVSLRYSKEEPRVLNRINFVVKPSEKIGIVGRTGAGKSSIITALFQLYPIDGYIIIDNIDTTKIPLDTVRSKISIIPQVPFLFTGTIRENLDPSEEHKDDVLWNVLEQVDLKQDVEEFPNGLDTKISEGGSNLSVGQRQLLCLARALILKNKILILDEATANVDSHTDALIQATIREKFSSCTVITIAHRLHTVMDSDKILVMDNGMVQEYNTPYILLKDQGGILRYLVDATGPTTSKRLEAVAEEAMRKKS